VDANDDRRSYKSAGLFDDEDNDTDWILPQYAALGNNYLF